MLAKKRFWCDHSFIHFLGASVINLCTILGEFTLFFAQALKTFITSRLKITKTFAQMNRIGVESLHIVVLTGLFTGMVLALQTYIGFQRVGGEQFIGAIVALGIIRELRTSTHWPYGNRASRISYNC